MNNPYGSTPDRAAMRGTAAPIVETGSTTLIEGVPPQILSDERFKHIDSNCSEISDTLNLISGQLRDKTTILVGPQDSTPENSVAQDPCCWLDNILFKQDNIKAICSELQRYVNSL